LCDIARQFFEMIRVLRLVGRYRILHEIRGIVIDSSTQTKNVEQ